MKCLYSWEKAWIIFKINKTDRMRVKFDLNILYKSNNQTFDISIDYYKHILCLIKCLFTLNIEINLVILFLNDLYPFV